MQKVPEKMHLLFLPLHLVEEQHVLNGNLEDITIEGVTDVLNKRSDHPKAVLLFTVCLHHFVGSSRTV